MRRAVLALGGTIAGLILLLSFRTHTAGTAVAGESTGGTSDSASPSASSGAGSTTGSGSTSGTSAGSGSTAGSGTGGGTGGTSTAGGTGAAAGSKVVTGDVVNGPYGPSQVQVTLTAGKLTKVTVLQHTDDGTESQQIDGNALPKLNAEALAAQSAKINAVSGASYTSAGYIKSLQSALDKAQA